MNELEAIVSAWEEAQATAEQTALATVISVEGSAYRRAGARMLIRENSTRVGSISAGCLETDVIERTRQVLRDGRSLIVQYDTRGNEDVVWGLGLGCNGIVRVLIESLNADEAVGAMRFISECLRLRWRGVVAKEFRWADKTCHIRTRSACFIEADLAQQVSISTVGLAQAIREDARLALIHKRSIARSYQAENIEVFFDVIEPPKQLVVFGAEQDAQALVHPAKFLGWNVTVVDTKCRTTSRERFRLADQLILCRPEEASECIALTADTAVVIMTHNYLADVELLRTLLPSPVTYLGILGPKARTESLLVSLRSDGVEFTAEAVKRLRAPVGVDIGAETPEEVALAIIAEIRAVDAARSGGFLRDRDVPIHDDQFILPGSIDDFVKRSPSKEPFATIGCAA